jgi:hypothetical protein
MYIHIHATSLKHQIHVLTHVHTHMNVHSSSKLAARGIASCLHDMMCAVLTSKLRVGVGVDNNGDKFRSSPLSRYRLQSRACSDSPAMSDVVHASNLCVYELCGPLDDFRQTNPQSLCRNLKFMYNNSLDLNNTSTTLNGWNKQMERANVTNKHG